VPSRHQRDEVTRRGLPLVWRLLITASIAACPGMASASSNNRTAPADATILFDGRDLSGWQHRGSGAPVKWKLVDEAVEVVPGTGDIQTKRPFSDFQLHVEFSVPLMLDAQGQARGNSGVYLQGLYEIQVLDSYGLQPGKGDCGAIYGQAPPMVNACRPPEQWQSYDILFHAPRFDAAGTLIEKPRVSVIQNGIWIQDNVSIDGRTTASLDAEPHQSGPILLQDHGNRVRYRNIWIRPLSGQSRAGG
jgi:3-keto-disaccharide hydrolase